MVVIDIARLFCQKVQCWIVLFGRIPGIAARTIFLDLLDLAELKIPNLPSSAAPLALPGAKSDIATNVLYECTKNNNFIVALPKLVDK